MTNSNSNDDIRTLVTELARSQLQTQEQIRDTQEQIRDTQEQIRDTQEQLRELTNDVTRVLARSAVLDDVLLELRDSHQTMQANFNENQRTTNAALNSLEAINLRLIEIIGREQN
jgi:predicted  nucleic acid-binding Zn-ribbon protein